MKKNYLLIASGLIFITWAAASCRPGIKMVSRDPSRTATLTPFAVKVTFTATNTPLVNHSRNTLDSSDSFPTVEPVRLDETQPGTETVTPSLTMTWTSTTESDSSLPSAAPSLTNPSSTPQPGQSVPTTDLPDDTATWEAVQPSQTTEPTEPSPTDGFTTATSTTESPTETPPPSLTAAPSPTSAPAGCSPSGNASNETQVINLINQEREERDLSPLAQNFSLRAAARRHSEDMACSDFFSHTGSDGSTLASRILNAGYSYTWAAENIAASSSSSFSASSVVNIWMNSTGHRNNILSENAVHIGVGFRYAGDNDGGDFDAYYTADFGRP
jgi:uncharacterized protein YkwD